MRRIYVYLNYFFGCSPLLIFFNIVWLYFGVILRIKFLIFIGAFVFGFIPISIIFNFYKKIVNKEQIIVKRKESTELASDIPMSLLLIAFFIYIMSLTEQYRYIYVITISYFSLNLIFSILNIFFGVKEDTTNKVEK